LLSKWPIRNKLLLGAILLLTIVSALSASGYYGLYAYRSLVKGVGLRSAELPLASDLSTRSSDLRVTLSRLKGPREFVNDPGAETGAISSERPMLRLRFESELDAFNENLDSYRATLIQNAELDASAIRDDSGERAALTRIDAAVDDIRRLYRDGDWILDKQNHRMIDDLAAQVDRLHQLVAKLPSHLSDRFRATQTSVTLKYRTAIAIFWVTSIGALIAFGIFVRYFYQWIFRPLRILINGSRRVAQGQFDHRIQLDTEDEMAELAGALNNMTARFQATRDDLDRQVQERTKQVVRSEQLASVGFLAAGVAHEINNPLSAIAMAAESLQGRKAEPLTKADHEHAKIAFQYLDMIQREAFRCRQITDKLLDFSRGQDAPRCRNDLAAIISEVLSMVQHMSKFRDRKIEFPCSKPCNIDINGSEIKQVILNLIANALESMESGGTLRINLIEQTDQVVVSVEDDGCGMTPEVIENLFEPFFTRKKNGKGTGLGMSISHRIISDYGGTIEAFSEGPGCGSTFHVHLPRQAAGSDVAA